MAYEAKYDRLAHSVEFTLNRVTNTLLASSRSDPFYAIANLSLNLWDQNYAKTMNASEMRECSKRSWALGKTFTIQSIPELRAFFFSQALSFLLMSASRICRAGTTILRIESGRTGRHIGDLEKRIILPAAPVVLCPVARHPLYQEQDRYGGDVFGTGRRGSCLLA